jgi:hypothetical protein
LIFTALGFTASTGLTVGIALRLNQLGLILLGLMTLAALNRRVRLEKHPQWTRPQDTLEHKLL